MSANHGARPLRHPASAPPILASSVTTAAIGAIAIDLHALHARMKGRQGHVVAASAPCSVAAHKPLPPSPRPVHDSWLADVAPHCLPLPEGVAGNTALDCSVPSHPGIPAPHAHCSQA